MYKGNCLCGAVSWQLLAEPFAIYNCHCKMCQRVHGTPFGTYRFVTSDQIHWTSSTDTIVEYRSSTVLTRASCDVCGSVVPYAADGGSHWVAPGGCHQDTLKSHYNIFVVDKPRWHTPPGGLPECNEYPDELGIPSVEGRPISEPIPGVCRGSCLCGLVEYHITQPLMTAYNCHCSRCRHGRAAAHASNGFVSIDGLKFIKGESDLKSYKVPDAKFFTQVFCGVCSSLMPRLDTERGIAIVPLGGLDDEPDLPPVSHIFVGSKANWHDITGDLPKHDGGPPARSWRQ